VMVPTHDGIALIEEGAFAEGYAKYIRHMGHWRTAGGLHLTPYGNQLCAKALIGMERFDEAKAQLTEAVEIIERTGHRMHEAEVHRVFGELWRQHTRPNVEAAETSYRKALEVARVQEAKSFELRASTNLALLWKSQGKRREAYALLAPVYNWFTEGLDTRDLKAAKALLDELA